VSVRLLVTRPAGEAERTAARLEALSHRAVLAPMLQFEAIPLPESLPEPAAIAFTSANAIVPVEASPASRHWRKLPVFCVGDRTAAAARAAGFADVRSAEGDVAELARLMIGTLSPGFGPILYAAAEQRRGDLDGELVRAGHVVDLVETYRMRPADELPPPAATALRQGTLDGVLLYSNRTALTLWQLAEAAGLGEAVARLPAFALSPAVLAGLAFETAATAGSPNEDALFALLPPAKGTSAAGNR